MSWDEIWFNYDFLSAFTTCDFQFVLVTARPVLPFMGASGRGSARPTGHCHDSVRSTRTTNDTKTHTQNASAKKLELKAGLHRMTASIYCIRCSIQRFKYDGSWMFRCLMFVTNWIVTNCDSDSDSLTDDSDDSRWDDHDSMIYDIWWYIYDIWYDSDSCPVGPW